MTKSGWKALAIMALRNKSDNTTLFYPDEIGLNQDDRIELSLACVIHDNNDIGDSITYNPNEALKFLNNN